MDYLLALYRLSFLILGQDLATFGAGEEENLTDNVNQDSSSIHSIVYVQLQTIHQVEIHVLVDRKA